MQVESVRLGNPKQLPPPGYQQTILDRVKDQVNAAVDTGEEIFYIDECTFSPKSYKRGMWAPVGDPIVF